MAERLLNDQVCDDPVVGQLSEFAELLLHRLRLRACPLGRYYAEPAVIRRTALANRPRKRSVDVAAALAELGRTGLVSPYTDSDGTRFLFIPSAKQTRLKHAVSSPFPAPHHGIPDTPGQSRLFGDDPPKADPPFKPEGREEKRVAPAPAAATREDLFGALCLAEGSARDQLTSARARKIALALVDILRATPDLTAAEISARATRYRRVMPGAQLTAMALAMHWSRLAGSGLAAAAPAAIPAEPEYWREMINDELPECKYARGREAEGTSWSALDDYERTHFLAMLPSWLRRTGRAHGHAA